MQIRSPACTITRTGLLACSFAVLALFSISPSSANECSANNGMLTGDVCIHVTQDMQMSQRKCVDADIGGSEARLSCQNAFSDCQNAIANSTVERGSSAHIAMIRKCTSEEKVCNASFYFNDEKCVKRAG